MLTGFKKLFEIGTVWLLILHDWMYEREIVKCILNPWGHTHFEYASLIQSFFHWVHGLYSNHTHKIVTEAPQITSRNKKKQGSTLSLCRKTCSRLSYEIFQFSEKRALKAHQVMFQKKAHQ